MATGINIYKAVIFSVLESGASSASASPSASISPSPSASPSASPSEIVGGSSASASPSPSPSSSPSGSASASPSASPSEVPTEWSSSGCVFSFTPSGNVPAFRTLVHAFDLAQGRGGWFVDTYSPPVMVHYGSEGDEVHGLFLGSYNGKLYQYEGDDDDGTAIQCHGRTASRNQGDTRLMKLYGDVIIDADTASVDVNCTIGFNNFSTTSPVRVVNTASRLIVPLDVSDTAWVPARNIALDFAFASTTHDTSLYLWESRWHEEGAPVYAYDWEICETSFDSEGYVYTGDLYFAYISTSTVYLVFTVDNVAYPALSFPSTAGLAVKTYKRLPVMKGKLWKVRAYSSSQFRMHGNECEIRVKQWGANQPWKAVRMFIDNPTATTTPEEG